MSTRYWVGGDGNWSQANYHWSDTSGGTPNASFLPTATDDVVFDADSNTGTDPFTVCVDDLAVAQCQDFSTDSLDGVMTLITASSTSTLEIYGSLTLPATNFVASTYSGIVAFRATTTGKTITTNGVTFILGQISLDGVGGEWTLGSAFTGATASAIIVINGSFVTNNFNVTTQLFSSNNSNVRSISLGSSTVTLSRATSAFNTTTSTNLTFNAGTSTIVLTAAATAFEGGGQTFNNVTFSGGAGTKTVNGANTFNGQFFVSNAAGAGLTFNANQNFVGGALIQSTSPTISGGGFSHTGTVTLTSAAHGTKTFGSNQTFQNLTITCPAVDGLTTLSLFSGNVISGTLTTTDGGSTARRVQIVSQAAGLQRTLTVATNSLVNTDFRDIAAAGTASWTFGLGYGDLGNNTGITFDSSTLYWIGGTGNWSSTTNWSTTSGGSAANAVPAPQNSVIFDAASNTATDPFTVTGNPAMFCNDFSTGGAGGALDGAMTLTLGATAVLDVYGSMTLPATNLTWTGVTGTIVTFRATTTGKTITTNGVTLTNTRLDFNGVGGEWALGSALTYGAGSAFNVIAGTFNTGNFNITGASFNSTGSLTRVINLGSSTVTLSATTVVTFSGSNLTLNAGTSTITCSGASPTFTGVGQTFHNVSFTSAANGSSIITGANTFNDLTFTSRNATGRRLVQLSENQIVNGTLTLGAANTAIRRIQVQSNAVGTQRTITLNGTLATLADVDFRDINAAGTVATPWTGTRIGNALNVSNITTDVAKTVYWNLAGSQNWSATGWATTNNGSPDVNNFPLPQDTATFTEAGSAGTVTFDQSFWVGSIQMADGVSNRTTAFTLATSTIVLFIYGNVTLFSNLTLSGTGVVTFQGQGTTQTITSAGVTFTQPIHIESPSGTVQFLDTFNSSNTAGYSTTNASLRCAGGTLDINNQTINLAGSFGLPTTTSTRVIAFGSTGKVVTTGNNMTVFGYVGVNSTATGSKRIECAYSGSTGTRTIAFSSVPEADVFDVFVTDGTDIFSVQVASSNIYGKIDFTGFTGTVTTTSTVGFNLFGDLVLNSSLTFSPLGPVQFRKSSGTQQITSATKVFPFAVAFGVLGTETSTYELQDNLTIASTAAASLTSGTLDLNDFDLSTGLFASANSNARTIDFGTGEITLTGNNTTIWNTSVLGPIVIAGTPVVNATYSGAIGIRTTSTSTGTTEPNAISFNINNGSDIAFVGSVRNLNFTGFSGVALVATRRIFGNLTISSGMTLSAGINITTFAATSGTQEITTNGKTLDFPITIDSPGATFQLQDAFTMGAGRALTFNNGTFDSNNNTITGPAALTITGGTIGLADSISIPVTQTSGDVTLFANTSTTTYTLTAGTLNLNGFNLTASTQFSTNNANVRSINFASFGKIILSGSGTVWDAATATNLTTSGSGMVSLTSASAKTFAGGGASYRTISQDGVGTLTLTGANTFVTIDNTVQPTTVTFPAGVTTSVNNFMLSGTSGNLVTINSSTPGTRFTLAQI
jgi:hypothetical protein